MWKRNALLQVLQRDSRRGLHTRDGPARNVSHGPVGNAAPGRRVLLSFRADVGGDRDESPAHHHHQRASAAHACYGSIYSASGTLHRHTHGPSPVPPIYLTGSFGLVRPAWI